MPGIYDAMTGGLGPREGDVMNQGGGQFASMSPMELFIQDMAFNQPELYKNVMRYWAEKLAGDSGQVVSPTPIAPGGGGTMLTDEVQAEPSVWDEAAKNTKKRKDYYKDLGI